MAQFLISVGAKHGAVSDKELLSHATTISRNINGTATVVRDERDLGDVDIVTLFISVGFCLEPTSAFERVYLKIFLCLFLTRTVL
jgi:hypothetical protein